MGYADGIQKLFTRFGRWNAKLDLKKVLLKPSPHPAIAAPVGLAGQRGGIFSNSPLRTATDSATCRLYG